MIEEIRAKFVRDELEFSRHAVDQPERLIEQKVAYTLFKDGQFYIIENVPARVDQETGEQFFAPKTVERLQQIILGHRRPNRVVQTPVFEFA